MADSLAAIREELSLANRILAHEGILDAFGHVSVRHPGDPGRFLISRHRAPELVQPADILEYTLDTEPVHPTNVRHYGERVIHGCIYQARPDVMAICHHHAPSVLAYAIARAPLVPVYHLGAPMGAKVPFWDSRDDFGDTGLVVVKPEEGQSLAKALGQGWMVLMGRHGATVAGTSIREVLFRTIFSCKNAELQTQAHLLGHVERLSEKETELAAAYNLRPGPMERAWDYWVKRLRDAEERAAPPGRTVRGAAAARPAKSSAKAAKAKRSARKAPGRSTAAKRKRK
jgi:ribulose-5-phosphate 4-epimerase/fuculose-1-phosphate aldolase